jgi:hypothetical protein
MQWLVQIKMQVVKISSLALIVSLMGCASEPFVTDEGSAAVQHSDRQNIEFQEEGVPRRSPDIFR